MAAAAKKVSQIGTHMAIAFVIAYAMTGSVVFGGLAVIIEPVINVMLLPFHERLWRRLRTSIALVRHRYAGAAAEKTSQAFLHAGVAFGVMYGATGSLAAGGLAAVIEPVCNVILLPVHDRMWDNVVAPRFAY
jgi:uncharacterized membrane protein